MFQLAIFPLVEVIFPLKSPFVQVNVPSLVTLKRLPNVIEPLLIVRFVAVILFAERSLILPPVAVKLPVVIVPLILALLPVIPLKVAYPSVPIVQVYVEPPLKEPSLFKLIFPPVKLEGLIVHPPIFPLVAFKAPPKVTLKGALLAVALPAQKA